MLLLLVVDPKRKRGGRPVVWPAADGLRTRRQPTISAAAGADPLAQANLAPPAVTGGRPGRLLLLFRKRPCCGSPAATASAATNLKRDQRLRRERIWRKYGLCEALTSDSSARQSSADGLGSVNRSITKPCPVSAVV